MHILTNLRTRAHGGPRIYHRTSIHISAQINKGRHQHHARRDKSRLTNNTIWDRAKPCCMPLLITPAFKFTIDLIPPATTLGAAVLNRHILNSKPQQNRFFSPLVHMPIAAFLLFSHAKRAPIKRVQRLFNRLAHFTRCCG